LIGLYFLRDDRSRATTALKVPKVIEYGFAAGAHPSDAIGTAPLKDKIREWLAPAQAIVMGFPILGPHGFWKAEVLPGLVIAPFHGHPR